MCRKNKYLIYVRDFYLVWVKNLVKKNVCLNCSAQVIFSQDQAQRLEENQSGTEKEADIGSRFY